MTKRLDRLLEIGGETIRAVGLINELRQGKNGANAAALAALLEREVRATVAAALKSRRRKRDRSSGKFLPRR